MKVYAVVFAPKALCMPKLSGRPIARSRLSS
jgi:hypothetical protein